MKYEMVVLPVMLLSPFSWTTVFIWKNDRPTEQLWLFRLGYLAEIFLKMNNVTEYKAREFQKNIYFCFIDSAKVTVGIIANCGKFLNKRWEYQTTLSASWEICMQVKKQQ